MRGRRRRKGEEELRMALRRSYAKQPAPDKRLALQEAFQALQDKEPTISDIIHDRSLPDSLLNPSRPMQGAWLGHQGRSRGRRSRSDQKSKDVDQIRRCRSDQKMSISRAVNAPKPAGPLKPRRALKPTGK
ncbi:hypothetical protein [Methanothrix sp.]|uniref:hypothetical protein n=1 Tax=Methanothrix sp. TaxID=90426 RepID=UPI003C74F71E